MPIPYPSDLPAGSHPFARAVIAKLDEIDRSAKTTASDNTATNKGLAASLQSIAEQIKKIEDASKVYYADNGNNTWTMGTGAVWGDSPTPPSVVASSLSGKFRVTVSGSGNNAQGAATFSTTGHPRDRALGGSNSAVRSRTVFAGGVSFVDTAHGTWIVELSPNTNHTFRAEVLNLTGSTSFPLYVYGLTIQVEPLL